MLVALLAIWVCLSASLMVTAEDVRMVVVTVATESSDGFIKCVTSAEHFGLNMTVLRMDRKLQGARQQLKCLAEGLVQYKDDNSLVILFAESMNTVFLAGEDIILSKFRHFNSSLVFSAEAVCLPDYFAENHPGVSDGHRYLHSGVYIGYAPVVYEAVSNWQTVGYGDTQVYFQRLYFNETFKAKHNMTLDHRSYMFQNLKDVEDEVQLVYDEKQSWIKNKVYNTVPVLVHGQGIGNRKLLTLGNYVPNEWTWDSGCIHCDDNMISLEGKTEFQFPEVLMVVFNLSPTAFFRLFLERLTDLDYPKSRITVRLYAMAKPNVADALVWFNEIKSIGYRDITIVTTNMNERDARNDGLHYCTVTDCSYYFAIDSIVMLENRNTLRLLIEQNKTLLSPMVTEGKNKLWSNFWGALTYSAYYQRSEDYIDIVRRRRVGVWSVPHLSCVYLIKGSLIKEVGMTFTGPTWQPMMDSDMAFTRMLRNKFVYMYVTNRHYFGHLLKYSSHTNRRHNDMYEIVNNPIDWKEQYIHPNYARNLNNSTSYQMVCPDVYLFPLISEKFAKELIEEAEAVSEWLDGKEYFEDPSASVPQQLHAGTLDLKTIEYEHQWQQFVKSYVLPIQYLLFSSFKHTGNSTHGFILRQNGQSLSFPTQVVSFSINISLSQSGVNQQGGGCHFDRYNCSVAHIPVGYALMYPGVLTHVCRTVPSKGGISDNLVSFIDN